MDSKKVYKKLGTWFWWILTALPLILLIGYLIACIVNLNTQGGSPLTIEDMFDYWASLDIKGILDSDLFTSLNYLIPNVLTNGMETILTNIGVSSTYLAIILSWGISIQFYHIIFDIMVWLPHKLHEFME